MTITYRDATADDLAAVDRLFRDSFAETFAHLYDPADLSAFFASFTPEAWAAELAQADLAIRLAEQDGALVGFAKVSDVGLPVEGAERAMELRQLYLADAAKGQGVADTLMQWVDDRARGRGAEAIYLSVYKDNDRAKRFYARHGFAYVKPYAFKVGEQYDEDEIWQLKL